MATSPATSPAPLAPSGHAEMSKHGISLRTTHRPPSHSAMGKVLAGSRRLDVTETPLPLLAHPGLPGHSAASLTSQHTPTSGPLLLLFRLSTYSSLRQP